MKITVVGMLSLAEDVTPELTTDVIASVRVDGIFDASDPVKTALADRAA
jgi:hypothetical protein